MQVKWVYLHEIHVHSLLQGINDGRCSSHNINHHDRYRSHLKTLIEQPIQATNATQTMKRAGEQLERECVMRNGSTSVSRATAFQVNP